MEERTKENRRIWDAIDNHTHDLSTQVIAVPEGGRKDALNMASPAGVAGDLSLSTSGYSEAPRLLTRSASQGQSPSVYSMSNMPVVRVQSTVRSPATAVPEFNDRFEAFAKEKGFREQQQGGLQELLQREKAVLQAMEELLAQERAERGKHQDAVAE